jgi:hypothetical protein
MNQSRRARRRRFAAGVALAAVVSGVLLSAADHDEGPRVVVGPVEVVSDPQ